MLGSSLRTELGDGAEEKIGEKAQGKLETPHKLKRLTSFSVDVAVSMMV